MATAPAKSSTLKVMLNKSLIKFLNWAMVITAIIYVLLWKEFGDFMSKGAALYILGLIFLFAVTKIFIF
ncbi:hypothetical protein FHS68_005015 [Dyadobacter arcticus]|uniref:Uncharacterized protein n=1 Tax=Dyadobacter arcticus TaxID=1078754 RepID=A0ABX0US97_9BACT|nr:hypothetical protein [Dyadobacter arcticus]